MKTVSVIALLLALGAAAVQAEYVYRHQFQYNLYDASPKAVQAVVKTWNALAAAAPAAGKPTLVQVYSDLGISKALYGSGYGKGAIQGDVGGRVQFASEAALRAFWKFAYANKSYQAMIANVKDAARIQYLANSCGSPAAGTKVYRHSFEYKFANITYGKKTYLAPYNLISNAQRVWAKAVLSSPAPVISSVFEADLGIGSQLYPSPNYNFAGSLDFASVADLTVFYNYLINLKEYQALLKTTSGAVRIQYSPTY